MLQIYTFYEMSHYIYDSMYSAIGVGVILHGELSVSVYIIIFLKE